MKLQIQSYFDYFKGCMDSMSDYLEEYYHVEPPSIQFNPVADPELYSTKNYKNQGFKNHSCIATLEDNDKFPVDTAHLAAICAFEIASDLIISVPSGKSTSIKFAEIAAATEYDLWDNEVNLYALVSNKMRPIV